MAKISVPKNITDKDELDNIKKRLLKKISLDEQSDCWNYTGAIHRGGYGHIGYKSARHMLAHRVSYNVFVGIIPDKMVLDHLCRNRKCVNPKHLEPVTQRQNLLRGEGIQAINAKKTKCLNGHDFDILFKYGNSRGCTKCNSDRNRKTYLRNKEKRLVGV